MLSPFELYQINENQKDIEIIDLINKYNNSSISLEELKVLINSLKDKGYNIEIKYFEY